MHARMNTFVHVYMRACWNGGTVCMGLGIDIYSYAHVRFIPFIGFTLGCT